MTFRRPRNPWPGLVLDPAGEALEDPGRLFHADSLFWMGLIGMYPTWTGADLKDLREAGCRNRPRRSQNTISVDVFLTVAPWDSMHSSTAGAGRTA
jgi:hypothetical protein